MSFKTEYSFHIRSTESKKILKKHQDRIPIICEKSIKSNSLVPDIDKKKFLVPIDLTVGQFIYVIRKRINLKPEQAIFIFINDTLPLSSLTISQLYHKHKDDDGFLYIEYSGENTFGNTTQVIYL